jgi:hypothetical protein
MLMRMIPSLLVCSLMQRQMRPRGTSGVLHGKGSAMVRKIKEFNRFIAGSGVADDSSSCHREEPVGEWRHIEQGEAPSD